MTAVTWEMSPRNRPARTRSSTSSREETSGGEPDPGTSARPTSFCGSGGGERVDLTGAGEDGAGVSPLVPPDWRTPGRSLFDGGAGGGWVTRGGEKLGCRGDSLPR